MITLIRNLNSIEVKFFAIYRDLVQEPQVKLSVNPGTCIADLKISLVEEFPVLGKHIASAIFSINQEFSLDDEIIPENAEIGMFPPVSGGMNEENVFIELADKPIDFENAIIGVTDEYTGAVCIFTGVVRQYTTRERDSSTNSLQYQAYREMALNKMRKVGEAGGGHLVRWQFS